MRRGVRLLAATLVAALATAACGDGGDDLPVAAPVPKDFAPAAVQNDQLTFHETAVEGARAAFADAGRDSLAADGRVWELRTGDRLVGVLQVTTLIPEVDVEDADHRDAILDQILPTSRDRIELGDIAIWSSERMGKTVYLWFGKGVFALLTIKPGSRDAIDAEGVLEDVIDHMVASDAWETADVDEDDEDDDLS